MRAITVDVFLNNHQYTMTHRELWKLRGIVEKYLDRLINHAYPGDNHEIVMENKQK